MATANFRKVLRNNSKIFQVLPTNNEFVMQGISNESLCRKAVNCNANDATAV